MKKQITLLVIAFTCAGFGLGRAYQARADAPFIEELTEAWNLDAKTMISRGLDGLADAGADEDDIAAILADIREGK